MFIPPLVARGSPDDFIFFVFLFYSHVVAVLKQIIVSESKYDHLESCLEGVNRE
jgi:hypothetical protein